MKETLTKDTLTIGGHEFQSRFILGSGKFSLEMMKAVISMEKRRLLRWR